MQTYKNYQQSTQVLAAEVLNLEEQRDSYIKSATDMMDPDYMTTAKGYDLKAKFIKEFLERLDEAKTTPEQFLKHNCLRTVAGLVGFARNEGTINPYEVQRAEAAKHCAEGIMSAFKEDISEEVRRFTWEVFAIFGV